MMCKNCNTFKQFVEDLLQKNKNKNKRTIKTFLNENNMN